MFSLPLLLFGLAAEAFLWHFGETLSLSLCIERGRRAREAGEELLFGRLLVPDDDQQYKVAEFLSRKPTIVALGSSTSMQHRAAAFGPYADQFYNLGGLIDRADDLAQSADMFTSSDVEVIILGLDLWWFNPSFILDREPLPERLSARESAFRRRVHLFAIRRLGQRLIEDRADLLAALSRGRSPVDGERTIGLQARRGSGFRASDGSWQYGDYVLRSRHNIEFLDAEETLERIEAGTQRFEFAFAVAAERVAALDDFLAACTRANILVLGVIGPYSSETREALDGSVNHTGLVESYVRAMEATFQSHGAPLVNAMDPAAVGANDTYMVDGFHGSETLMARVLLALLELPGVAQALPRLDPETLRKRIESSGTTPAELTPVP